jgi:hypothetical protein
VRPELPVFLANEGRGVPDGLAISARARDSGIKAFDFTSHKETSSLFRAKNLGDWRHGEMNGRKDYNSIAYCISLLFSSIRSYNQYEDLLMTEKQINLSARLKMLGFAKGNQMKLYGQVFELVSEPIVMSDDVVLVDATESKSGHQRRVRIPLPIVNMASAA